MRETHRKLNFLEILKEFMAILNFKIFGLQLLTTILFVIHCFLFWNLNIFRNFLITPSLQQGLCKIVTSKQGTNKRTLPPITPNPHLQSLCAPENKKLSCHGIFSDLVV